MKNNTVEKNNLHPRNLHRNRYNFEDLTTTLPALKSFVFVNKFGVESIDFANAEAVKLLNKAILMHFYSIKYWEIPEGYIVPPVPGRADYIHYLADLLSHSNQGRIPVGPAVTVLDIGTGANCIYPIIGVKEYDWQFIGADIDPVAINSAKNIIANNEILSGKVTCILQKSKESIFENIITDSTKIAAVMCNPPFHANAEEAAEANLRKQRNLSEKTTGKKDISETNLNFGGHSTELWTDGGEKEFIKKMIKESKNYKEQVLWFSSLVSEKRNIPAIENALKNAKVAKTKIVEMAQGQKLSRFISWTFIRKDKHEFWING